jgi:DMSO/TMAO reductase YedYZ molybdopterin-dependent catalytic subunit
MLPDACVPVVLEATARRHSQAASEPTRITKSIDLIDASHPQTILAYELNRMPLPLANGASLRVSVERQLGYKMAFPTQIG